MEAPPGYKAVKVRFDCNGCAFYDPSTDCYEDHCGLDEKDQYDCMPKSDSPNQRYDYYIFVKED